MDVSDRRQLRDCAVASLSRVAGLTVSVAVHGLFALTVWRLFLFLRWGKVPEAGGSLLFDAGLALLFSAPHSLLLHPAVKKRICRVAPAAFYGLFFTAVTCLTLLLTIEAWQGVGPVLWSATGFAHTAITGAFYLSWAALFYSLWLTGLGHQTGWTPWLAWVRGEQPPRREFRPRGAYLALRHPVYLSVLGLIWFTPTMTLDHAVLTLVWSVYILVGSRLKDRRLEHYLGDAYRDYERRVPGYPFLPAGPLARLKTSDQPGFSPRIVARGRRLLIGKIGK